MTKFYFDDYKLISTKKSEAIFGVNITLLVNGVNTPYAISCDEENFYLHLEEEFNEKNNYEILLNNKKIAVLPRFIMQTARFDKQYGVDVSSLGSFIRDGHNIFSRKETVFRLWSPLSKKAEVVLGKIHYPMTYIGRGIYEFKISKNMEGTKYHYEVQREKKYSFPDPFSYLDFDENESFVINPETLMNKQKVTCKDKETVIYEVSVRDFSSQEDMPFKFKKKFLALTETGLKYKGKPIGLDHLKELGISHVQLMPVFSFNIDKTDYNWGYNPMTYNSLEQSYLVSKEANGLNEFRMMVDTLHANDIKVTLDVVFNHAYGDKSFNLGRMVPYYFFRYYKNGYLGNASGCGNEIRSEAPFVRDYLKLMVKRFIEIFDIDGLRFDLMGIIDKETMNEISELCKKLKPGFLVYGEGWNMGDIVPYEKKAIMENASQMKDIAFFNYHFREAVRGRGIEDRNAFMLGDLALKEEIRRVLEHSKVYGFDRNQTINYTECHDNYTVYDKVLKCTHYEPLRKRVCEMAMGLCILAKGIPFIHSGQEFLRTKDGIDNTYNLPDSINKLDWKLMVDNLDVSEFLRDLIKIRNEYKVFSDDTVPGFYDYYEVLVYELKDVKIFINSCAFEHIYDDGNKYRLIFDGDKQVDTLKSAFTIAPFAIVIALKESE
ncbi:MAG: alpha-amylase family glycosyl hydrolase [Erysipelotrichaceae bacterium]|nr:alpha-amylase family glycosyl hydrolase [Erysipelotrichaceae bacterium]